MGMADITRDSRGSTAHLKTMDDKVRSCVMSRVPIISLSLSSDIDIQPGYSCYEPTIFEK